MLKVKLEDERSLVHLQETKWVFGFTGWARNRVKTCVVGVEVMLSPLNRNMQKQRFSQMLHIDVVRSARTQDAPGD